MEAMEAMKKSNSPMIGRLKPNSRRLSTVVRRCTSCSGSMGVRSTRRLGIIPSARNWEACTPAEY